MADLPCVLLTLCRRILCALGHWAAHKPVVRCLDGLSQSRHGPPAEPKQHTRIEAFSRRTVRLAAIEANGSLKANDIGHQSRKVRSRYLFTAAHVDWLDRVEMAYDVNAS